MYACQLCKNFWVSSRSHYKQFFSVKLSQIPPFDIKMEERRNYKKKDLSRSDSNHRGIWVSFTNKNYLR